MEPSSSRARTRHSIYSEGGETSAGESGQEVATARPVEAPSNGDFHAANSMVHSKNFFPWAGQAEVIRAMQKDDYYTTHLKKALADAIQAVLGARAITRHQNAIENIAGLVYFGLTTGSAKPTLGEEYCEVRQLAADTETSASRAQRAALIVWKLVVPYVSKIAQMRIIRQNNMRNLEGSDGRTRARWLHMAAQALPMCNEIFEAANRLHLAAFYMYGMFYSLPHRFAEIRHISLQANRGHRDFNTL
ncbi:hypothetical protein GUITHDRAFT_155144 [Guillardia theta CCMP2712]|uniref:RING-type E3 ubiquitin transferase n=3 Tax=Guillardia theta TaxID=55529 RepID=L1ILT6_GUITC|nr:hypothetical protein GUITHDRAFT_155144 [Guillardia theta CCMP2712]EKX36760.1 hypothetical protein GUITHDRAFT_155144 [Guillardia theta CCMP2712]|eukprot:XP_005823740.1 hypothetical protein GUITHDRAFT_155144 [Guillardia theta CCMP2712]